MDFEHDLASWVMDKVNTWGDFYDSNFQTKHDEYERIWRGIWQESDKTRNSERSKIVAPHTAQAVESSCAEVEEAIYGRGTLFDVDDDVGDEDSSDVVLIRTTLDQDLKRRKVRKAVSECVLSGAVFGTGVAEIVTTTITERTPASRQTPNGVEVGVEVSDRVVCDVIPVPLSNFRIDPAATSVDDGCGVAIDDHYVPVHQVQMLQDEGVYDDFIDVRSSRPLDGVKDQGLVRQPEDVVRITKYYGLVPRDILYPETTDAVLPEYDNPDDEVNPETKGGSDFVEAIVVILNGQDILKAEESPYMMQDRPVVAFAWDITPGMFYGRGVPEKGYSIQKSLDAELRARNDALALTAHPMMAIDGTKMPRGMRPKVTPGRTLITQGNPHDALMPFNFGEVGQISFVQAEALGRMLQQATGAVDSTGVAGTVNNEAAASGISMSLGAIIKRHKRTLVNFNDDFLVPLIEKTAWRYMQYDPDRYPAKDYNFNVSSSLGIMAREYETTQLVQLLQTMPPESPQYALVLESVIENMSVSNREQIVQALRDARTPSEEEKAAQAQAQQVALAVQQGQADALQGQAAESNARATKYLAETKAIPVELQNERIRAISQNLTDGDQDETNFRRRVEVVKLLQTDRQQDIAEMQARRQE